MTGLSVQHLSGSRGIWTTCDGQLRLIRLAKSRDNYCSVVPVLTICSVRRRVHDHVSIGGDQLTGCVHSPMSSCHSVQLLARLSPTDRRVLSIHVSFLPSFDPLLSSDYDAILPTRIATALFLLSLCSAVLLRTDWPLHDVRSSSIIATNLRCWCIQIYFWSAGLCLISNRVMIVTAFCC